MSLTQRLALAAVAAAIAVGAFVALRPGDDEPEPPTATQTTQEQAAGSKGGDHDGHAGGHAPGGGRASTAKATGTNADGTVIETRGTEPVGGITVIRTTVGSTVRFAVDADSKQEIHVHGYDLKAVAAPGKRAAFAFPANIEGVFEVELEGPGVQIARLMVEPR